MGSLLLMVGIAAGWWAGTRQDPPEQNWSAQMLGGPDDAATPRISPDGHTLAFQAGLNGTSQIAVMDADSGDWTFLTKNRSRGNITDLNWSVDGSRIYFDSYLSVPHGIYTASRFGGDEHLVLENARGPEVLPDGSLRKSRDPPEGVVKMSSLPILQSLKESILKANVKAVYGEPIVAQGKTIIPVAKIIYG